MTVDKPGMDLYNIDYDNLDYIDLGHIHADHDDHGRVMVSRG